MTITDRQERCCPCWSLPQSPAKPKICTCFFQQHNLTEAAIHTDLCQVTAQTRYSQLKGNNRPVFGLLFVTASIKDKLHGSLHCLDFFSFSTIQPLHFCHSPLPRSFCGWLHGTSCPFVKVLISLHILVLSFQLLLSPWANKAQEM